jgi:DNA-binding PadR family transcriptional regulator
MALEHAILVSLSESPGTGYDLARRFDASVGYFATAPHQQIYRVPGAMEDNGLVVVSTLVPQPGRADKNA